MRSRWVSWLTTLMVGGLAVTPALADEVDEVRALRDTTVALVKALVQQGVLTQEKADELIRKAEEAGRKPATGTPATPAVAATPPGTAAPAAGTDQPPVIRVPYIPQTVREQIRDEVKQEVLTQAKSERWGDPGALPDWLKRISFNGDVRVRYQGERFPNDNVPNATPDLLSIPDPRFGGWPETNSTDKVNIVRLRARLGLQAKLGDTVTAGLRLATGGVSAGSNPSTENQTLGNYNVHETFGVDLAFLTYRPFSWLSATAGRMGRPFFAPTTMVWANDLSLEGGVINIAPHFGPFDVFATAGAFPILNIEPTPLSDAGAKWMYGYQGGFGWKLPLASSFRAAVALYDYRNLQGILNPDAFSTNFSATAAPSRQGGNTVFDINGYANALSGTQNYLLGLSSKFNELNFSASLDVGALGSKHVLLDFDWVKNLGYNYNEILARTGQIVPRETRGMQERIAVGDTSFERRNSWQAYIGYRRAEADSVVDAFTEADFHLGGTNAKGYYLGGKYAFESNSTIEARWFSAKQITGLPLAIDLLQIDVMAAF